MKLLVGDVRDKNDTITAKSTKGLGPRESYENIQVANLWPEQIGINILEGCNCKVSHHLSCVTLTVSSGILELTVAHSEHEGFGNVRIQEISKEATNAIYYHRAYVGVTGVFVLG
jgi:hypothetical protein